MAILVQIPLGLRHSNITKACERLGSVLQRLLSGSTAVGVSHIVMASGAACSPCAIGPGKLVEQLGRGHAKGRIGSEKSSTSSSGMRSGSSWHSIQAAHGPDTLDVAPPGTVGATVEDLPIGIKGGLGGVRRLPTASSTGVSATTDRALRS